MKRILLILLTASALFGCSNKKAEKSAVMDQVMKVHEKVMEVDGQVIANRMKLDTLLKDNTLAAKDTALQLNKKLTAAEDAMEDWMHKFDYEQKGKSDEEVITYMNNQKKLIMAIDSQLNIAVTESNLYLKKIKSK
jgi:PBP1b-binding outer membrane lipoprotein LpoB